MILLNKEIVLNKKNVAQMRANRRRDTKKFKKLQYGETDSNVSSSSSTWRSRDKEFEEI